MENQLSICKLENQSRGVSLKLIVSQLVLQFQPMTLKRKSFIINDVPDDIYMYADKDNLVTIINSLLISIIDRSRRSCIRITANRYSNIIVFRLKESADKIINISEHEWQKVKSLAKRLDHCVIENDINKEHAMFVFSFCSLINAA